MYKSLNLHPARKAKIRRPEQNVQIGIMSHLLPKQVYQRFEKFLVFHVPNGGARSKVEAGIMQAMGTLAGVADITLLIRGGITVFIELKIKTWKIAGRAIPERGIVKGDGYWDITPSREGQDRFAAIVRGLGFRYESVAATDIRDGLDQILNIMAEYGV